MSIVTNTKILISCSEGDLSVFFACKLRYCTGVWPFGRIARVRNSKCSMFNELVSVPDPTPIWGLGLSLVPRPNPLAGKRVWCTSSDFLGFQDAKQSCDINYCHGNALSGMRVAHVTTLWPHLRRWCAVA